MIYFVNEEKLNRAKKILELFKRTPKNEDEIETHKKFTALLVDAKIKPDNEDALQFIYEKLGGLIRSEIEQKEALKQIEEIKKKKRKE